MKKTKSKKTKSSNKNKKIRIKIIFPIVSFLFLLSGIFTICFTFKNHFYYENLLNKYQIEANNLETKKINNQYLNLLNDLNQDQNLYDNEVVKFNENESFDQYLQNYLSYLNLNQKYYQDFKVYFISTYLNNNSNIDFKESLLDDYDMLKKYTYLNYELVNNVNKVIPNNDGFISGIFLITFGTLSLVIYLSVFFKIQFKKRKSK
ncbi:MAG: hypothetical protein K2H56_02000 [Malacoplasma sp.]|nr:hypothetical protein [Malacoplasma sp.]